MDASIHQYVPGRAVQVDTIKFNLKLCGTERLKLTCDILLSTSAEKFNLRRYNQDVGPCLCDEPAGAAGHLPV